MSRRGRSGYQRTDRIAEAIRSIVATELERIGDDRLELVTVTAVEVDADLQGARVFYSALSAEAAGRLEEVTEALEEVRWPIQRIINREIRARRTPQISFLPDDVLRQALRLEDLMAGRVVPAIEEDGSDGP